MKNSDRSQPLSDENKEAVIRHLTEAVNETVRNQYDGRLVLAALLGVTTYIAAQVIRNSQMTSATTVDLFRDMLDGTLGLRRGEGDTLQ